MSEEKRTSIVIFGASGDLTRRKLVPALFSLCRKNRLPRGFLVLGTSRTEWDTETFRNEMRTGVDAFYKEPFSEEEWAVFSARLHYMQGDVTQQADYDLLRQALESLEQGPANRLFYLAMPPQFFAGIVKALGQAGLVDESDGWKRVVIEKPFGYDLESAKALNREIHSVLDEHQVYRIDHYLAKETVQNLLVLRFANAIFEPIWNRNYVDHVQITAAESVDVGHRAGYYEKSGVLRDMFQNHLLQLLTLVAMEPPASFEADAIRNEKVKVLAAVRPIEPQDLKRHTVRAQYRGYRQTEGVDPHSETPTFAALRLQIDNWRWQGVPFYLRSGKALAEKTTEILIVFQSPPHNMFPMPPGYEINPDLLAICIQPDEGIHLRFEVRVPDSEADMRSVNMEFHYRDYFGADDIPEAYERLLLEALEGDASLFTRADSIELAWGIIDPILKGWQSGAAPPLAEYVPGSWGPAEAAVLLAREDHAWLHSCGQHEEK